MSRRGYSIVSPTDVDWTAGDGDSRHKSFTDALGCSDAAVDVFRPESDEPTSLPTRLESTPLPTPAESLCVPIDAAGELTAEESRPVPRSSVTRVPAGVDCRIGGGGGTTWLVVSAPTGPSPGTSPMVIDVRQLEFEVPTTSDVLTARLTDRLGCRGTKANVRRLRPGDVVPYHTEGTQEELFVPLDGPGTVRVDSETHHVRRGSVTRVAPALPRSAVNPGDRDVLWLIVGAPPTGSADEWDPGAEIHEWPGRD